MEKTDKTPEQNRTFSIEVSDAIYGVVYDSATHPEQYFQVDLSRDNLPEKATPEEIHRQEWTVMQKRLNCMGYNPRDNSHSRKIEERKKILERNLKSYLSVTGHREENFLNHLLYMTETYNDFMLEETSITVREWISNLLNIISLSSKANFPTKSKKDLDNQTEAYIIHFKVQMGAIKADKVENNYKAIKHGKYLKFGDFNSYKKYRNILNNDVKSDRIIESCQAIVELKDIDPAIKAQAKSFLPR